MVRLKFVNDSNSYNPLHGGLAHIASPETRWPALPVSTSHDEDEGLDFWEAK